MLASHRREITVVFCDLRGFTAATENAEPEDVMTILREYHASLGELIFRYEGTLDALAGDGIMVIFNDPLPCDDHTERAIRMALDMRDCAAGLAKQWQSRGHDLGFGVGIATGYATLGQIGFNKRMEYTAIGSVINLASRLCGAAADGEVIVSKRVLSGLETSVDVAEPVERTLKGFTRPVSTFAVQSWKQAQTPEQTNGEAGQLSQPQRKIDAMGVRRLDVWQLGVRRLDVWQMGACRMLMQRPWFSWGIVTKVRLSMAQHEPMMCRLARAVHE